MVTSPDSLIVEEVEQVGTHVTTLVEKGEEARQEDLKRGQHSKLWRRT
jgi:hypothetical protein